MTDNSKTIREVVICSRKKFPITEDVKLSSLKSAEVGTPIMVYTPERSPSFWLVPYVVKKYACGFAFVELSGSITKIGIFGSAPEDRASWIEVSFFENPPDNFLREIQAKYFGLALSHPYFSYDRSPAKWAWRLEISDKGKISSLIFITPSGWYERNPEKEEQEIEG